MFDVGIPEGLPPLIAPEPECRPRRPEPQPEGLRPHPIPISIKAPIFRNFDHFSDHYRRETLPATQDVRKTYVNSSKTNKTLLSTNKGGRSLRGIIFQT